MSALDDGLDVEDEDEAAADEETYGDGLCPWWGQEIKSVDRWSTGELRCSRCGRSTVVVDGERLHRPPEAEGR